MIPLHLLKLLPEACKTSVQNQVVRSSEYSDAIDVQAW